MKDKIIKGITVIIFVSIISAFVAYKSGYFESYKSSDFINGKENVLHNQNDSVIKLDSSKEIEMMPSSKVLILKENPAQSDDTKSLIKLDSNFKIDPLLYGSKSGIIFKPVDLKKLSKDSIVNDSIYNE